MTRFDWFMTIALVCAYVCMGVYGFIQAGAA